MTTESAQSMLSGRYSAAGGDLAGLHTREVERLVAYLCSSDRAGGASQAEDIAGEAFLELASAWPNTGAYSRPEVFVFAAAERIAVARSRRGHVGARDALSESATTFWDRADVARLTVLQDALDRLPGVPRHIVLLREMIGFSAAETAEITGLSLAGVESARADALRALAPAVDSGTARALARPGALSPDDFAALSRMLQHGYRERLDARRQLGDRLTGGSSWSGGGQPGWPGSGQPGWSAAGQQGPGWAGGGSWQQPARPWEPRPWESPLETPLPPRDLGYDVGTPIFDAVSAWFASGTRNGASSWAALNDGGFREASARAAAEPEVDGLSVAGLPQRRPGANALPSVQELAAASSGMFGERQPLDANQVGGRLGSFQQGVRTARQVSRTLAEAGLEEPEPAARPGTPVGGLRSSGPLPTRREAAAARGMNGTAQSASRGERNGFTTFYRDYLPQLLAELMAEGARPAVAAELAQDVLAETRRVWSDLDAPQEWVRERALAVLAEWQQAQG